MEGINFKRDLTENFIEVFKSFERLPRETLADIGNPVENIKNVDPEKGEIIHEFIECLIILQDGVRKETELHTFHKKYESIEKAFRLNDKDYDAVDRIMNGLRQNFNVLHVR